MVNPKHLLALAFTQLVGVSSVSAVVDVQKKSNTGITKASHNTMLLSGQEVRKNRIIISAKNVAAIKQIVQENDLKIIDSYSHISKLSNRWVGVLEVRPKYSLPVQLQAASMQSMMSTLQSDNRILQADYDSIVWAAETPNDPKYSKLWGLHNTGQDNGTEDADIDAPETWELFSGSDDVIVMVIDSGVDYNHPDLARNMWKNPGEIEGNGIDDDQNGYVDDIYGIDTANNDSDPWDDHYHGTHCAGTISARGNNGLGVVGVNWNAKIMACKFLNENGSGSTSDAIKCLDYMIAQKQSGQNIVASNNSWGGGAFAQTLLDAIETAGEAGILFLAAAGNEKADNDSDPYYPATYDSDYVISVAATDRNDQLANFSSWGATTVDLGAPGVDTHSTGPNNTYMDLSGTSMATPHVAGVVSLLASLFPNDTPVERKNRILNNVDSISSLSGRTLSGGRLNALKAVESSPFAVAKFSWAKQGELTRQFTDNSKTNRCEIVSWQWDFGDGQTSTEQAPVHSYNSSGWYDVTLTVKGDACAETSSTQAVWAGPNLAPVVDYVHSNEEGFVVNYTDLSKDLDGEVTGWLWSFGDGQTSSEQFPSYKYPYTGTFNVSLTATDDEGASATLTKPVVVPLKYCKSSSFSPSFVAISKVQFGSFSNSSGKSEYSDFLDKTINVNSGDSYNVTISLDSGFWGGNTRIWMDFNLDGFFTDDEMVFEKSGVGTHSGSITIPTTGIKKGHKLGMRVTTGTFGFANQCDSWSPSGGGEMFWGEVEDYAVIID
ncbi:S8 family serine peptidase [Aliikangiella coralliicola]|uniref:S8 family serine peptidase n=1 Tax=Aliikangiella coralliicola TaxID=2592383 RepID=A0A545UIM5_9GAMM|nr:S8 family serine peptidase [Aliikangiella coralliicola]TQV89310.1 S8 family serine peptidase [Aliikangiella coralliicola]